MFHLAVFYIFEKSLSRKNNERSYFFILIFSDYQRKE